MKYACPMHPEVVSDKEGKCPKCGMRLVPESSKSDTHMMKESEGTNYNGLFLIIGLIALAAFSVAIKDIQTGATITHK